MLIGVLAINLTDGPLDYINLPPVLNEKRNFTPQYLFKWDYAQALP